MCRNDVPVVMALLVMLATASVIAAGDNKIAYGIWGGNQIRVMVMDDSGANPNETYRYGKFSTGGEWSISPLAPDGSTWIAIEDMDLYKVQADGTGLTTVLCYEGTDVQGQPYQLSGHPQWSPDGNEILVDTYEPWGAIGLLPSDSIVGSGGDECASDLLLIYDGYSGEGGFEQSGGAVWNDDGSQIAFFEAWDPPDQGGDVVRLVILERQETGIWVSHDPLYPDLPEGHYFGLDWQRGGSIAAFVHREETGRRANFWLTWIDTLTGDWGYLTEAGSRLEGLGPSWSPDGSQLIFSDRSGDLVKWTYPDGSTEVVGSGTDPDWQRDRSLCETDTDCNDGNECTMDQCTNLKCTFDPADLGLGCSDGDDCTVNDGCDGAGSCIGTLIPGCGCLPKGASCTSDGECCSDKCRGGGCR